MNECNELMYEYEEPDFKFFFAWNIRHRNKPFINDCAILHDKMLRNLTKRKNEKNKNILLCPHVQC